MKKQTKLSVRDLKARKDIKGGSSKSQPSNSKLQPSSGGLAPSSIGNKNQS